MEGVDGVRVVEVHRGRLVGDVHRVLQRQVPHGERLVLGVAGRDAALMLVVQLRQARGHLARAGAGRRHHHEGARRFHVFVLAVALFADDAVDVVRIAGDRVVQVAFDAQAFQAAAERAGRGLVRVVGDHHAAGGEAHGAEDVHEAQHVLVVGDAQVSADLALLDVVGVDGDDDLHLVGKAFEHADLGVGLEPGQHARGMVVVEQLSAEFQIELAAELVDAVADVLCLKRDVLVVVESDAHEKTVPLSWKMPCRSAATVPRAPLDTIISYLRRRRLFPACEINRVAWRVLGSLDREQPRLARLAFPCC